MTERPAYVYVTYIKATPEQVWRALTDADLTARYWGHRNESDWQPGSTWQHVRTDGSGISDVTGTVLEALPPERLVHDVPRLRGAARGPLAGDVHDRAAPGHRPADRAARRAPTEADLQAISAGWPAVMANLKSLLETGDVLPQAPWEMHAELREAQMAANDPS